MSDISADPGRRGRVSPDKGIHRTRRTASRPALTGSREFLFVWHADKLSGAHRLVRGGGPTRSCQRRRSDDIGGVKEIPFRCIGRGVSWKISQANSRISGNSIHAMSESSLHIRRIAKRVPSRLRRNCWTASVGIVQENRAMPIGATRRRFSIAVRGWTNTIRGLSGKRQRSRTI